MQSCVVSELYRNDDSSALAWVPPGLMGFCGRDGAFNNNNGVGSE